MKKLAFMFAAVVAVSFASCGNGTQACEETADTVDTCAVEEVCEQDTCEADTCEVEAEEVGEE